MRRVPHSREVNSALSSLRAATQKSLTGLNRAASERMAKGDYAAAEALASGGKDVQQFKLDVESLHQKWRTVCRGAVSSNKGSVTPLWGYFQPVLRALICCGGQGSTKEVERRVEPLLANALQPGDQMTMARGRERWRVMMRRTRAALISEGWIDDCPGGIWRITPAGRLAAENPTKQDQRNTEPA
jgi:hypothetical protein